MMYGRTDGTRGSAAARCAAAGGDRGAARADPDLRDLVPGGSGVEGPEPELIVMLIVLAGRVGLIVKPGHEVRDAQRAGGCAHGAQAGRGTGRQGEIVVGTAAADL